MNTLNETQIEDLRAIKEEINKGNFDVIALEVGLVGNIIKFNKKADFGMRVLSAYRNADRVIFKGAEDGILYFKQYKTATKKTASEERGYHLGLNQGD